MKKGFYTSLCSIIISGILLVQCTTNVSTQNPFDTNFVKQRMKSAFEWQLQHPKWAKYDWTNATLYRGISAAWKATQDKDYFNEMLRMGKIYNWKLGERWFHADDLAISLMYLDVFEETKDSTILRRTKNRLDANIKEPVWHFNPERNFEHSYINQLWWWCDALFMAPPVFVRYSKIMKDDKYLQFSDSLFHKTYESLYDKKENLFSRDERYVWKGDQSDIKDKFGNKIFWSRGNGWVLGGLALIISDLPDDYPSKSFYVNLFKEMSARIKSLQPEDGLWRPSLLDSSAPHGEMSGTALFTFAMAWGVNNNILSKEEYLPAIEKSWEAMLSCQKENGMISWVQQIGKDPKPASAESWEVYGTGAFLMAGSEILKLKRTIVIN